tara:strand:- start:932 stop:1273 length:342 start_codon:yes stop_codon:yes gene_type:complete
MKEIQKDNEEPGVIHLDLTIVGEDEKEDEADVLKALTSEEFKHIVKTYLFDHLSEAIKQNKKSFIGFRLLHQEQDYIIEKTQYKKLMSTILTFTEEDEDYAKCAEIKKLIDTI